MNVRTSIRLLPLSAWAVVAALGPPSVEGQNIAVRIGAEVYATNCANQYCHGASGAGGAAPAIAGRGTPEPELEKIIRNGVPNTSMPGWEETLPLEELEAVIAYAAFLQQQGAPQAEESLDPNRPWLNHPGRELFFDTNRISPCGSCHAFDGLGLAIAPAFGGAPTQTVAQLRAERSARVKRVRPPDGAPFAGVSAPSLYGESRWYDLSGQIPVLRTFKADAVAASADADWSHESAVRSYSDAELEIVLDYVRTATAE